MTDRVIREALDASTGEADEVHATAAVVAMGAITGKGTVYHPYVAQL